MQSRSLHYGEKFWRQKLKSSIVLPTILPDSRLSLYNGDALLRGIICLIEFNAVIFKRFRDPLCSAQFLYSWAVIAAKCMEWARILVRYASVGFY